jgi:hypothetical protein
MERRASSPVHPCFQVADFEWRSGSPLESKYFPEGSQDPSIRRPNYRASQPACSYCTTANSQLKEPELTARKSIVTLRPTKTTSKLISVGDLPIG